MTTEHYHLIENNFTGAAALIASHRAYLTSPQNPRPAKDLERRLRWDTLHHLFGAAWVCAQLYPYLNDEHIDTALRSAMAKVPEVSNA